VSEQFSMLIYQSEHQYNAL